LRTGLELLGGQALGDLDDLFGGLAGRDAADLRRLGAVCAGAPRNDVGVSLQHRDLLDRDPETLRGDHRERRLVALALRQRAGLDDRLAACRDLDGPELGLADAVGDLYIRADPDAELARGPAFAAAGLLPAQFLVPGLLERQVERPLVVADVVV